MSRRMPIVGDHPEHGVRVALERPHAGGPPWRYEGDAFTRDARYALSVTVEANGEVDVHAASGGSASTNATVHGSADPDPPRELLDKVRLIVRAAFRQSREAGDDAAPPRRIQRWRGEK
jgi:hypothetical protein